MGQYGLLHPSGNSNLRAPLRGTFFHRLFLCVSWTDLFSLLSSFRDDQAVYDRFSHIQNFQPKFYIGSTLFFALDREHSCYRKLLQVQQNIFVLAKVALRFWNRFDNFWMSILPLYTGKSNFWALEHALIQLWQPRLNIYSVHVPIFQLPERHHQKNSVFDFTTILHLLTVAETKLGFHTKPHPTGSSWPHLSQPSRPLGHYPGLELKFSSTVSCGEADSFQCHWPPGMLFSPPAFNPQLATELGENHHFTCGHDATPQYFTPTTLNQHRLHQVPIGHG
jgi:hypothetical protein